MLFVWGLVLFGVRFWGFDGYIGVDLVCFGFCVLIGIVVFVGFCGFLVGRDGIFLWFSNVVLLRRLLLGGFVGCFLGVLLG